MKDTKEVIDITQHIFGVCFASSSEIRAFVEQELQEASGSVATTPSHPSQHTPAAVQVKDESCHLSALTDIFTWTHNLVEEEAPGYLPLGYLGENFVIKIECHI